MDAPELEEVGVLMFEFVGDPQLLEVHVYNALKYSGTPEESDGESQPRKDHICSKRSHRNISYIF